MPASPDDKDPKTGAYDVSTVSAEIIERIAEGESLRSVCRSEGMPAASTFIGWVNADSALAEQYARAMDLRADAVFDELFDIADDGTNDWTEREDGSDVINGEHVQRSRLRIDARKWALARMNPRKYGDQLKLNHSGGVTVNVIDSFGNNDTE